MSAEKQEEPWSPADSLREEFAAQESDLRDPVHDTLHRGLKARQISMIAVCPSRTWHCRHLTLCGGFIAWRCSGHWLDHWFRHCARPRWPPWHLTGLFVCRPRVLSRHGCLRRNGGVSPTQEGLCRLCRPVRRPRVWFCARLELSYEVLNRDTK